MPATPRLALPPDADDLMANARRLLAEGYADHAHMSDGVRARNIATNQWTHLPFDVIRSRCCMPKPTVKPKPATPGKIEPIPALTQGGLTKRINAAESNEDLPPLPLGPED